MLTQGSPLPVSRDKRESVGHVEAAVVSCVFSKRSPSASSIDCCFESMLLKAILNPVCALILMLSSEMP